MNIYHWVQSGIDRQDKYLREDGVFLYQPTVGQLQPHMVIDVAEGVVGSHPGIAAAIVLARDIAQADFERRKAEKIAKAATERKP
jgi:hypothetical protein